jgi:hypothetical protein
LTGMHEQVDGPHKFETLKIILDYVHGN